MDNKKRVIILISIALILAIVAISLRVMDSKEVPTSIEDGEGSEGTGEVGVTIVPTGGIEDKMADNTTGEEI